MIGNQCTRQLLSSLEFSFTDDRFVALGSRVIYGAVFDVASPVQATK
jgi:hypothetical protein